MEMVFQNAAIVSVSTVSERLILRRASATTGPHQRLLRRVGGGVGNAEGWELRETESGL